MYADFRLSCDPTGLLDADVTRYARDGRGGSTSFALNEIFFCQA